MNDSVFAHGGNVQNSMVCAIQLFSQMAMLPLSNDYAITTYGAGVSLSKEECINHIDKRLGTALRNVVSKGDASTFK